MRGSEKKLKLFLANGSRELITTKLAEDNLVRKNLIAAAGTRSLPKPDSYGSLVEDILINPCTFAPALQIGGKNFYATLSYPE